MKTKPLSVIDLCTLILDSVLEIAEELQEINLISVLIPLASLTVSVWNAPLFNGLSFNQAVWKKKTTKH